MVTTSRSERARTSRNGHELQTPRCGGVRENKKRRASTEKAQALRLVPAHACSRDMGGPRHALLRRQVLRGLLREERRHVCFVMNCDAVVRRVGEADILWVLRLLHKSRIAGWARGLAVQCEAKLVGLAGRSLSGSPCSGALSSRPAEEDARQRATSVVGERAAVVHGDWTRRRGRGRAAAGGSRGAHQCEG